MSDKKSKNKVADAKEKILTWLKSKSEEFKGIKGCFYFQDDAGRLRYNSRDGSILKLEKEVELSEADKKENGVSKEWKLVTSQKYEAVAIVGNKLDLGTVVSASKSGV